MGEKEKKERERKGSQTNEKIKKTNKHSNKKRQTQKRNWKLLIVIDGSYYVMKSNCDRSI